YALALIRARIVEAPLNAELLAREIVRGRKPVLAARIGKRFANRLGQIAALGAEPAVVGPLDRIEQRLPPERAKAVLVAVIHQPPVAARAFDERRMASRPPFLIGRLRAHDGI